MKISNKNISEIGRLLWETLYYANKFLSCVILRQYWFSVAEAGQVVVEPVWWNTAAREGRACVLIMVRSEPEDSSPVSGSDLDSNPF